MDEALSYAIDLRKLVPDLAAVQIECLVIGGKVEQGQRSQLYRWGAEGTAPITVTPMTWGGLLERARMLSPSYCIDTTQRVIAADPPDPNEPDDDDEDPGDDEVSQQHSDITDSNLVRIA
jgi:hypothetical protein